MGKLADIFAERWPGRTELPLEPTLEAFLLRARAERSDLPVDEARLVAFVASQIPADSDPVAVLDALHAGDLALACACAAGTPSALATFERELVPAAVATLRTLGATDALLDEAVQLLRERLLVAGADRPPRIAEYAGRGQLARWVKAAAGRTFLNHVRGKQWEIPVGDELVFDEVARPETDPELAYLKKRYGAELKSAFLDALAALSDTHKNLLRFRHLDGLGIDEIAALHRVHRATAHRWLAEAREALAAGTEALLRTRLHATATEVVSLCRLVRSQLEISLTGALG